MCVMLCQLLYIHHTAVNIECGHQRMDLKTNETHSYMLILY